MDLKQMGRLPAHLVRRVHQHSTAIFAEELATLDLTALQYAVLVAVTELPVADITRISEAISTDKATLGSVIDRLEGKNLVTRVPSPGDRRVRLITCTSVGKKLLAKAEAKVQSVQDRLTANLSSDQREAFIASMVSILEYKS